MDTDALLLARLQFAFTIAVHIIFPAFSIGSSAFVATLLVLWRRTGKDHFHRLARFWTRIFAVSFAMGVVSGIPLSYQFGTNWSEFSRVVGNVIGPLIGYEVLAAFFLEASFLGVMLFGWKRVPPWLHVTSAVAFAVWRYWEATRDGDLLRELGVEILAETARFWTDLGFEATGAWMAYEPDPTQREVELRKPLMVE